MPVCKMCEKVFPNRVKIGGVVKNLSTRLFCLDCSPYGKRNRRDLTKSNDDFKICPVCKERKPVGEFYVRKRDARPTGYCKVCNNARVLKRHQESKRKAVDYKGGACEVCGYSKCIAALDFHHKDPGRKDFGIARIYKKSFEKIKVELDKCLLVCSNCHREIHYFERRGVEVV